MGGLNQGPNRYAFRSCTDACLCVVRSTSSASQVLEDCEEDRWRAPEQRQGGDGAPSSKPRYALTVDKGSVVEGGCPLPQKLGKGNGGESENSHESNGLCNATEEEPSSGVTTRPAEPDVPTGEPQSTRENILHGDAPAIGRDRQRSPPMEKKKRDIRHP